MARPRAATCYGAGLLRREHFQLCYATNDMKQALEVFRVRFGIAAFRSLSGQMASGAQVRVELAWAGGTMYELVTACEPGAEFYMDGLPEGRFGLRHHHLGYLVPDLPAWDEVQAEIAAGGWPIRAANSTPGFMRHCYIEVPDLSHYLEYIYPEAAGLALLQDVPNN